MPAILLFEPDPDFRVIYGAWLRHAGYMVIDVATADEALRVAAEGVPSLAVISLKASDAWSFLERVRQELPVLALTWDTGTQERDRVLRRPLARYAARPADAQALRRLAQETAGGA